MTNEENNFQLPTNVKQVGSISDGSRIYMEDYACTYIEQYAASEPSKEKIAVLIGKTMTVDNETVIFVSGVLQGKYTIMRNGMPELTEKSWQYVEKQIELYFKDLGVVGWAYIQPGFEDYISDKLCQFQRNNLTRGLQLLYVTDPTENISSFYKWDVDGHVFNILKGYIVYYEKNEGMHEYMLENKLKPVVNKDSVLPELKKDSEALLRKITSGKRTLHAKHNILSQEKGLLNLLGGVSFIMLLVCFVMGAGLIQSDERISAMEQQIAQLQETLDGTQSVFASQTQQTTVQAVKAQKTTVENTTVPTTVQTTVQTTQATTKAPEPETQRHSEYVVKEGDTLIKISKSVYGNTSKVNEIRELNKIEDNNIVVGHKLLLP